MPVADHFHDLGGQAFGLVIAEFTGGLACAVDGGQYFGSIETRS